MNSIQICEWGRFEVEDETFWTPERRDALGEAAGDWRRAHNLNAAPLEWGGRRGLTLRARQWVGVIEIEGDDNGPARVEIYPKTDRALLDRDAPSPAQATSTLRALLRMLEASDYGDWVETDRAALDESELTFPDLWAYVLGRHLWPQLRRGLPSAYLPHQDDLTMVRGRIQVGAQIARYGERMDRIVCAWDEFSPDTPMMRLLKCACRFLRRRARHPVALGRLGDCLLALDEVRDETPATVLRQSEHLVWTRATQRFRPTFNLARSILRGQGPQMGRSGETTWAFLVDMNRVFEKFCRVAIEDKLGVVVEEQKNVGHLLRGPSRMRQLADLKWEFDGQSWIGDAKWKLLSASKSRAEAEEDANDEEDLEDEKQLPREAPTLLSRVLKQLSTADVRQLTTYAELTDANARPQLAIFYPSPVGTSEVLTPFALDTWNETQLHFIPVSVADWASPSDALPYWLKSK